MSLLMRRRTQRHDNFAHIRAAVEVFHGVRDRPDANEAAGVHAAHELALVEEANEFAEVSRDGLVEMG